jgi:hypothetical protein
VPTSLTACEKKRTAAPPRFQPTSLPEAIPTPPRIPTPAGELANKIPLEFGPLSTHRARIVRFPVTGKSARLRRSRVLISPVSDVARVLEL